jgi:hypothetical protein
MHRNIAITGNLEMVVFNQEEGNHWYSLRLIPDSGVVFSGTIVLGPKARDSKAQANGLGL